MPKNEEYQSEYQNMAFHPYNIILTLGMISLGSIFVALSAAFIYARVQSDIPPIRIPNMFLFNTLILLASSGTMVWAKRSYLEDHTDNYRLALWATIGLSILFMFAQVVAWNQLFSQEIFINTELSTSYLYVISILHFGHVIAGLPFLGLFLWRSYKEMKEPVSVLIYFSNPEKRLKLRLLTIYWHFLDALWIYLILFFYLNYFI